MKHLTAVLFFFVWCAEAQAVDWQLWEELSVEAVRLYTQGNFRAALQPARRAVEEARLAGKSEGRLADSLDSIGLLYFQFGEYRQAEKAYLEAIAVAKPLAGYQTRLARAMDHLASLYYEIGGRASEVESLRRRAVRVGASSYGANAPEVALLESRLANSLGDRGKFKEAEELVRKALRSTDERQSPGVAADMYRILAALAHGAGKNSEALLHLDRAGELYERLGGRDSPGIVLALIAKAVVYLKMGNAANADDALGRAEVIAGKVFGAEHPRMAQVLEVRGTALRKLGRRKEADAAGERSQRIIAGRAADINAVRSRVHAAGLTAQE